MDYRDIDLEHVTDWIPAPDSPEKVNLYEYFKSHGPRVEKHTCICCGREFESHTDFPGLGKLKKYYCPQCLRKAEEYQKAVTYDRRAWIRDEANRTFSRAFKYYPLPSAVKDASFDNFTSPDNGRVLEATKEFVTDRKQAHLLIGKTGTGKTHLCVAAIREFCMNAALAGITTSSIDGADALYITESELVDRLKMEFQTKAKPSLMEELETVPLLVLDEFGRARQTDFGQDRIQHLLLKRYDNEYLKTVIAGNVEPTQQALSEVLCSALVSRYADTNKSNLLTVKAEDRRRK